MSNTGVILIAFNRYSERSNIFFGTCYEVLVESYTDIDLRLRVFAKHQLTPLYSWCFPEWEEYIYVILLVKYLT